MEMIVLNTNDNYLMTIIEDMNCSTIENRINMKLYYTNTSQPIKTIVMYKYVYDKDRDWYYE